MGSAGLASATLRSSMSTARTFIVFGAGAIAVAGVALYVTLGRDRAPAAPPPPTHVAESSSPTAAPATGLATPVAIPQRAPDQPALPSTEKPALPPLPNGSAAQTPAEIYAVETRDPAWAPTIEAEIQERFAKAPAKVVAECHQSRCQLSLDGGSDAVSNTIAMFESEKGLLGFADQLYLTAPDRRDDGTLTLRAFASFQR